MAKCRKCNNESDFLDEKMLCAKCILSMAQYEILFLPQFHGYSHRGNDVVIPSLEDGSILEKSKWDKLKNAIEEFYATNSSFDISIHNESIEKETPNGLIPGYIYLMSSSVGYYKVGRTTDLDRRQQQHRRKYPIEINLLHSVFVQDSVQCEAYIKRGFSHQKAQGEWFSLSDKEVQWFCSLTSESLEGMAARSQINIVEKPELSLVALELMTRLELVRSFTEKFDEFTQDEYWPEGNPKEFHDAKYRLSEIKNLVDHMLVELRVAYRQFRT